MQPFPLKTNESLEILQEKFDLKTDGRLGITEHVAEVFITHYSPNFGWRRQNKVTEFPTLTEAKTFVKRCKDLKKE